MPTSTSNRRFSIKLIWIVEIRMRDSMTSRRSICRPIALRWWMRSHIRWNWNRKADGMFTIQEECEQENELKLFQWSWSCAWNMKSISSKTSTFTYIIRIRRQKGSLCPFSAFIKCQLSNWVCCRNAAYQAETRKCKSSSKPKLSFDSQSKLREKFKFEETLGDSWKRFIPSIPSTLTP